MAYVTTIQDKNGNSRTIQDPEAQRIITDCAKIGSGIGLSTTSSAASQAQTASLSDFILLKNIPVSIRFTKGITSSNATLDINSTGAKPLYISGTPLQPGVVRAGMTVTVVYDGTNYNIVALMGLEPGGSPSDLWVDMGLPSGLKWAKKNIDITQANGFAASEYQYECTFFSWGNVDGHNPVSASAFDYNWGTSNDGPYASTPGAAIHYPSSAGPSYDIARVHCGAPWRLPLTGDFQELFDNCDFIDADGNVIAASTADKRTTINGITGLRLQSKVNGATLFFPCSGYGYGTSWLYRGSDGYYWSQSLYSEVYGRSLVFYSGGVYPQRDSNRFDGFAGRPVQ